MRGAIEAAKVFGDSELLGLAGTWWTSFGMMPWSDANEALQVAEDLTTAKNNTDVLWGACLVFWSCGRRDKLETVGRTIKQLAAASGYVRHVMHSHLVDLILALLDGRLEEAIELLERDLAWRQEVGLPDDLGIGAFFGFWALEHLNGIQNNPESIVRKAVLQGVNVPVFRRLPMAPAHLGQVDEANQRLDRMLKARPNLVSKDDTTSLMMDAGYLESAILIRHRRAAELLVQRFANGTVVMSLACIHRMLGGAGALLERYDEARQHYQEAVRVCTEMSFRPELALSRLELAELLLDHYPAEKKDALEHLDFAIKEFREMKMQPSLERALRRKEILKA